MMFVETSILSQNRTIRPCKNHAYTYIISIHASREQNDESRWFIDTVSLDKAHPPIAQVV